MDHIILISNKYYYQDVFSEFLYFPPLFLTQEQSK